MIEITAPPRVLIFEGKLPGLNELIKAARDQDAYGRLKKRLTARCAEQARDQFGENKPLGPVHIEFLWFPEHNRRDPDNVAAGGRKFILDGMVDAGVLVNDTRKHVIGFEDRFGIDRQRPRTELYLREVHETEEKRDTDIRAEALLREAMRELTI